VAALVKEQQEKHEFQRRRPLWGKFAVDSPLEGDGFELLVPRHKSRGFPQHSGHCGGIGGALKRYHLIVLPFFFCTSNHSIEPGWGTVYEPSVPPRFQSVIRVSEREFASQTSLYGLK
jgi:hypothetical protein